MGDPSMSYFCSFTYWFGVLESDCWYRCHQEQRVNRKVSFFRFDFAATTRDVFSFNSNNTYFVTGPTSFASIIERAMRFWKKMEASDKKCDTEHVAVSPQEQHTIEINWEEKYLKLKSRVEILQHSQRYRVAMLVVAREDSAVFVAFDASMTKLTNVMAVEVANPMNIVGKSYIFHLKLTELYSLLTIRPSLSPQSLTLIRESQGMSLHHNNPPEVVDETTLPAEAVQPTSNTDQLERIIGGNVDDPHGSPPGNPSKKAWIV
ncbi:hypothetical protein F2Q68_00030709 [Brassica cretica]|uniref:Uncharacterized protein n=1 Tax=Brassica cretica TaxID=69181 RepID=A0A8S9G622_BRACR|nr:hypothetical protein F2Q68_00030709 [Brassica cretica]